ncbi:MAG TPA: hypothetical protein PK530_09725 [Anaerolineales bacterium]|nr:hypothetical protein [Anaerolineales bacterium]
MMNKSNLQSGIWLIGIGVLALTNTWWPGIMFVVGLSVLIGGSPQGALWLFGIGLLAMFDFWWPGILFLVGLSILAGAIFPDRKPETAPSFADAPRPEPVSSQNSQPFDEFRQPTPTPSPPPLSSPPPPSRLWLPTRCPACGAPLTPAEVLWHDDTHAECSYCHTQLAPGK